VVLPCRENRASGQWRGPVAVFQAGVLDGLFGPHSDNPRLLGLGNSAMFSARGFNTRFRDKLVVMIISPSKLL